MIRSTSDSCTLAFTRIGSLRSRRLKIFCRSRTVAPSSIWAACRRSPVRVVGIDDEAVDGAKSVQFSICFSSLSSLVFSSSQAACLASSSDPLLLDLDFQLLGSSCSLVYFSSTSSLAFACSSAIFSRSSVCSAASRRSSMSSSATIRRGRGLAFRGQGLVQPLAGVAGPLQPGLGLLNGRPGRAIVAFRAFRSCLRDPLGILGDGDLGDLAGELGVLVGGLGRSWS